MPSTKRKATSQRKRASAVRRRLTFTPKRTYANSSQFSGRGINRGFTSYAVPKTMGFPAQMRARLRYITQARTVDPSASAAAARVLKLNHLQDPETAITGDHQPRGFDEYAQIYDHYQVIAANWRIIFSREVNATLTLVGASVRRENTPLTSLNGYLEAGDVTYKGMGHTGSSKQIVEIRGRCNIAQWLGMDPGNPRLESEVNTGPAELLHLHCFAGQNDASNPAAISCIIQVDYDVIFREKKNLTQS